MDCEWMADRLVNNNHLEDGPKLDNIDLHEINYDYILDDSAKNDVLIQEWDNRYL